MPNKPTGRFTTKILRHPAAATSRPPTEGPTTSALPPAAVHNAIARARATSSSPQAWF